jgi:hypothetical protein
MLSSGGRDVDIASKWDEWQRRTKDKFQLAGLEYRTDKLVKKGYVPGGRFGNIGERWKMCRLVDIKGSGKME